MSAGLPFHLSYLSPHYEGLAKRRDTCLVDKLTDFAKEGVNKIRSFLAHSSEEEATLCTVEPSSSDLWPKRNGTFFGGKKALISS